MVRSNSESCVLSYHPLLTPTFIHLSVAIYKVSVVPSLMPSQDFFIENINLSRKNILLEFNFDHSFGSETPMCQDHSQKSGTKKNKKPIKIKFMTGKRT